MSDPTRDENVAGLLHTFRQLYHAMPQPNPANRLAACYHAVTQASGLDEKEATQAMTMAASALYRLPHAKVSIYHMDGSVESFVTPGFHFDIRPGSPYYTDANL
jgi:hypothetical protein